MAQQVLTCKYLQLWLLQTLIIKSYLTILCLTKKQIVSLTPDEIMFDVKDKNIEQLLLGRPLGSRSTSGCSVFF